METKVTVGNAWSWLDAEVFPSCGPKPDVLSEREVRKSYSISWHTTGANVNNYLSYCGRFLVIIIVYWAPE